MLGDDIPDDTDWMAHKMVEIVSAGIADEEGLFAGTPPEHPAMGRVVVPSGERPNTPDAPS